MRIPSRVSACRIMAASIACLVATLAAPHALAQTLGDAARGQALGENWCSSCHLVSPASRPTANDGAPSFQAVARQPTTTSMGLRVFLQTPHPRMPNDVLSVAQTDDIVAYILSLKR
jgi:mono/diheme cytochrome c family protein